MFSKINLHVSLIILLTISFTESPIKTITPNEIEEGKKLIESEVSCDKLSDEQLEAIGEYLMEQMHPGEAHELMDKMMGGEGSESLKQMHIQMAKRLYCNEDVGGMMGMMMGGGMMGSGDMMGGNMMSGQTSQTNTMQSMMGNWGYGSGYWNFINILYIILLIGLIILVYLWILKLWKNMKNKGSKK